MERPLNVPLRCRYWKKYSCAYSERLMSSEIQIAHGTSTSGSKLVRDPSLLKLCAESLYVGVVGYGGPAILVQMKRIFVDKKAWICERDFMDALSLAQLLPGATGVSLMAYIGHKLRRPWGAILAPVCFVLPAMALMIGASWVYFRYENLKTIQSLFAGLGALVVALLINATFQMARSVFKHRSIAEFKGALIALLAFLAFYFGRLNMVFLVPGAGVLGLLLRYPDDPRGPNTADECPAEVTTASGGGRKPYIPLLAMGLIAVAMICFPQPRRLFATFASIGTFAFGGGFAAIPLIQSKVVDQLHWVSLAQFRDGIALGQVTPGPVFITATFIGYKVMGIGGALIATAGIFLPSLVAMMALMEAHNKIKHLKPIRAVIRGILAGFIGLLAGVTLQFALKSLIVWQAWLVCCGSLLLIRYYKKDVLWAIAGTALISPLIFR